MKKFALIMALALVAVQLNVFASAATTSKTKAATLKKTDAQVYKQDGNDYLLKYNIDDLEAAPWINNGKRVYDNETYSKYTPMGKNSK